MTAKLPIRKELYLDTNLFIDRCHFYFIFEVVVMKKTIGIIRKTDSVGHLMIPARIRKQLNITKHDQVEYFFDEDRIVLRKYQFSCVFCDSLIDVTNFKGKAVCSKCKEAIEELIS